LFVRQPPLLSKSVVVEAPREIVGTLFDSEWYARTYLDSIYEIESSWDHFVNFGAAIGYDPNQFFDTDWYLAQYPEVSESNENPLLHYMRVGAREGKDPNPFFGTEYYLQENPDVQARGVNPLQHFIEFGYEEGRIPFRNFWPEEIRPWEISPVSTISNPDLSSEKKIAIVIPVFNNWFATERCLRAIQKTSDVQLSDIVVVDDGSTDDTLLQLKRFPAIRVISTPRNMGFTKACNFALEQLKQYKYLYLLNNDTEVLDGFISQSVDFISTHPKAAIVGSTLHFQNGLLQECGAIVWSDGTGHNFGRGRSLGPIEFKFSRQVDYCSGAGILIRNEIFNQVGLFDELYAPAYYEDVDLSFKFRQLGYETWVCVSSRVIHHEGLSHGKDTDFLVRINREKFCSKWKVELINHHKITDDSELILRAAMQQNKFADPEIVLELTKLFWTPENS